MSNHASITAIIEAHRRPIMRRERRTEGDSAILYEHIKNVDALRGEWYVPTGLQAPYDRRHPREDAMARKLTKSNAHFQRAVKKLPLGVASNFRYWGEERTIYVKRGKGARIIDLDDNSYVDYRMGYGPAILGYADERVDAAARAGHGGRRRVRAVDGARTDGRRAHLEDGAGRRAGALLEFRHRGGDGGSAPGARLHRQGRLRDSRGRLSRPVRCGHVVHADGQVVAGRRPGDQAVQRRRAGQHAELRALRAGQRCQSARGRVQAPCARASPAC